jgi:hypothetical protein
MIREWHDVSITMKTENGTKFLSQNSVVKGQLGRQRHILEYKVYTYLLKETDCESVEWTELVQVSGTSEQVTSSIKGGEFLD